MFNSTNVVLKVNDDNLGYVQKVEIEDFQDPKTYEKYTKIVLHRFVSDHEDIINTMRFGKFAFSLTESPYINCSGYVSTDAETIGFRMELGVPDQLDNTSLLKQIITIKARSFTYVDGDFLKSAAEKEKQDYENLFGVLKRAQEKQKEVTKVVLPKESVKSKKSSKKVK